MEPRMSFGHRAAQVGPVAQSIAQRAGLAETGARLQRANAAATDDDEAAIQDDSPAARLDVGERVAPALQPLGTLAASLYSLPTHRILPRRSPRGPPVSLTQSS
jgi:hypothetical protein